MQIEFPKQTVEVKALSFDKKKVITCAVGVLFLIIVFAMRLGGEDKGRLHDFFAMQAEAALIGKGEADFEKLSKLIKQHSEVAPFFDGALIQSHFLAKEPAKAAVVEERALKRLKHMDENYLQFAKGSVLIEQGQKEKALESAIQLQDRIEGKKEYLKVAFFNLVRIGLLEEALKGKAKDTWARALNLLSQENELLDDSLRSALISHLSDGKATIFDFLASRH